MGKFPSRAMGGKVCVRPHTQVAISFSSEQGKASGGGGGRDREREKEERSKGEEARVFLVQRF